MGDSRLPGTPPLLVASLGAVLFFVAAVYHWLEIQAIERLGGPLVAFLVDGLPALGISYGGYWLSKADLSVEHQWTVVAWTLLGVVLLVAVLGATLLIRAFEGRTLAEPQFVLLMAADVGAISGFTAGYYKARADFRAGQLRRANQELAAANQQLEASNERLEQFASVLSHDLKEPLRMVSSYVELLERRYGDDLDDDAREFVDYAVDGAERMQSMIESLLEYSRVETRGDPMEPTDADAVLDDVLRDLEFRIEETAATVTADDLPTVRADPDQLAEVFRNLLTNALRHSGDEPPRIHVGVERTEDGWQFSVRDEGVGIDPDDQDRIFDVFEQLDGEDGNSGTSGIGLALCERIVDRHGGDIWVDSEPGEGTTFSFTFPATEAEVEAE